MPDLDHQAGDLPEWVDDGSDAPRPEIAVWAWAHGLEC